MRFSDRITFVNQEESYFDPSIGDYVESEKIEVTKACKISPMGIERQKLVFGELNKNVIVVRLQHPYSATFDTVEVDGNNYKVMRESNYRKGALFLEGDNFANKG